MATPQKPTPRVGLRPQQRPVQQVQQEEEEVEVDQQEEEFEEAPAAAPARRQAAAKPAAQATRRQAAAPPPQEEDDYGDQGDHGDTGDDDDGVINLAEADENAVGVNEVMPRGRYKVMVNETEYTTYSTGSKGIKVQLEVCEGQYAAGGDRKKGKLLFMNIVASAKAANALKANLKALGVSQKVYNSPNFRVSTLQQLADSGDLIGRELWADVTIKTYEGEKNNNIRRVHHISVGGSGANGGGSGFLDD